MPPSQFWRRYAPGKVIEYPGHNVEFSAPVNFDVEPAKIMSTQSPNEPTEQQPNPNMVDLTMDQAVREPTIDTMLPKFDAVCADSDEEHRRLERNYKLFNPLWIISVHTCHSRKAAWRRKPSGWKPWPLPRNPTWHRISMRLKRRCKGSS